MQPPEANGSGAATLQLQPNHRFETLDALRGVAALLIVQVHLPFLFADHMPFPHAYLAVDFFFMLSGFVLTYAYGARLANGWPTRLFLRDRLFRLYPLYVLAFPLGFVYLLYISHRNHTPLSHATAVAILALGLVFLPLPSGVGGASITSPFPANLPSWSLFYELAANVVHALVLRSLKAWQLAIVVALAGLALVPISLLHKGVNLGALKGELLVGFVRVTFSYTLGMLLLELWRGGRLRRFSSAALSTLLLAGVLLSPVLVRGNGIADLVVTFVIFPAVILLAANAQASPRFAPLMSLLGTTSYAIYVLHVPAYAIFTTLWSAVLHSKTADHAPISGLVYMVFLLILCYLLDRFYDLPVRRFLRRSASGSSRTPEGSSERTLKRTPKRSL